MAPFATLRVTKGILPLHQLHPPVLLPALSGVIRADRLGVPQPLGLEARAVDLVVVEEILPHRGRRRVEITDRRARMGIESSDRERPLVGWRSW
jgi:hypothetical protein